MSMSEMSKARYKALRVSVRTNGLAYTVRTMCSVLEAEDVLALFKTDGDNLADRAIFQRTETKRNAFFMTVIGKALRVMLERRKVALTHKLSKQVYWGGVTRLPLP